MAESILAAHSFVDAQGFWRIFIQGFFDLAKKLAIELFYFPQSSDKLGCIGCEKN
jgi:hypothetical protein